MNADIIVIGAGPGGMEIAAQAIERGLKVIVIERDLVGGTCLNRGCIPTKALCRSAQIAADIKCAIEFGVNPGNVTLDYATAISRKNKVVDGLRGNVETLLSAATLVKGDARLVADGVVVNGELFQAPKIVIATGSEPATLPIPGAEHAIDSTDMLNLDTLPQSLVIIGGGVIGMEFASILSEFGVNVTVIEYAPEILPAFDRETAKRLRFLLSRRGVKIITGAAVTSIDENHCVHYQSKDKDFEISADTVLMAVGRKAVIPDGAAELGIETGRRGIVVDDNFMTAVPGIYAIGDVNGRMMLAHVAEAQARSLFGEAVNLSVIPADVFTTPECAMVGATEEECKTREGLNFKAVKSLYRANGKAAAMGEPDGFVKLIVDTDTRLVLGCHIVGAHAADIIQEVATVMASGLTVDAITSTVHAHPTLTEVVSAAARNI